MKTRIYKISSSNVDAVAIKEAGEILRRGGLVAFPTETVYGLGGDALNDASAARIYAAKGRPVDNPLIVHLGRIKDITAIALEIPEVFYTLAEEFWPGPLTMILKKSPLVPDSTTGGLKTVAVRMPNHQTALKLIEMAGGFVAAPSANLSGRPSPTKSKYVIEDMDGRVEMIIDGGETEIGLESTILDLTTSRPEILRPGSVTKEMLDPIIATNFPDIMENSSPNVARAPGMKYRHYAPKGRLIIVDGEEKAVISYINAQVRKEKEAGLLTGVIASSETWKNYDADEIKCIGARQDEEGIAHNLYRVLRELDDKITDVIYSETFSSEGIGQAIMNRLLKAASYQVVRV